MKQRLLEIIKKALTEQPKKKKCDCGCDKCLDAPLLNESKQYSMPISENMRYHLDKQISIHDNTFRPGSKAHIDLIHEARLLWKKGVIELQGEDKKLFENTDLGRFGVYEGEVVPLDLPMMEILTEAQMLDGYEVDFFHTKANVYANIEIPSENPTFEDDIQIKGTGKTEEEALANLKRNYENYKKTGITEAELEEEKKQPALGKPKRGGSKKFYVYVKDPKTKRIKKVSFGMAGGGLRAKLNNSKARSAFSKRHNCPQKKDRTKASYWSCRLPRYSKLLGFKTTFSGYW
jgi:predicted RNase H-like HicB family nuclease